ncbi:hypothetical protein [Phenylobacterium sp.]|jgi:ABC-type thiamine transport system ATPase subunit|uniref:hypothetical protein n=1 Tax=Phenylobacterium sp. TaxID=1871053 RepID=UPI002F95E279
MPAVALSAAREPRAALARLLVRLDGVDLADPLELAALLADLREQLEAVEAEAGASEDLLRVEALICAAEAADDLDRAGLVRLLQLDLLDLLDLLTGDRRAAA